MSDRLSEEIWDRKQVANYLKVGQLAVMELHRSKNLPMFKIGNRYRARKRDIDAWLDRQVSDD